MYQFKAQEHKGCHKLLVRRANETLLFDAPLNIVAIVTAMTFCLIVVTIILLSSVAAVIDHSEYNQSPIDHDKFSSPRRSRLRNMADPLGSVRVAPHRDRQALADATDETLVDVYFGVGCYWHIQHEFVQAERDILGRTDLQLTARTGYAGGTDIGPEGRVCYHNFENIADYGKLGHAEVVGLKIPGSAIQNFSEVYFDLFNPETGERVDPQDQGPEYRSLIGLPGGIEHPMYPAVKAAGDAKGFHLETGKGNDPDTLGNTIEKLVYVYDSDSFPFHQAEVYMQFRDDFQSAPYGKEYNTLVELALEDGRIIGQGCPDTV